MKTSFERWRNGAVRSWPVLVPVAALAGLAGWKLGVVDPAWRRERAAELPVRRLIAETDLLRRSCSDFTANRMTAKCQAAEAQVWPDAKAATAAVQSLVRAASEGGWTVRLNWAPKAPLAAEGAPLGTLEAHLVMNASPGARRRWEGVESWLANGMRDWPQIGISRLAVRADVQGRYTVEATLRLAYLLSHAEIPQ